MSARKPAKPRKAKAKAKKVTPCVHGKSFTVTPARNSKGRFAPTKAKQKSFRF